MTSMKTSLKSSIDSASFQTISQLSKVAQLPNRRKFVLEMKRGGPRPGSDRDGRIYRLAVPVLKKKTLNLVISRCSCAGTAKKYTKKA